MTSQALQLRPQPGAQEAFLYSAANIAIYGGAAGGGKTFAILLEALRNFHNPNFGAVIFRREGKQISNEGGLWDTATGIYQGFGGRGVRAPVHVYKFPSGARVTFDHLNQEDSVQTWQGSQIALIGFDELTHFTKSQFFYMLSRNRSTCGVRPYVRATCNPDADSWVAEFISWWIDQDTGYPIASRAGKIRYFLRGADEQLAWGDDAHELASRYPGKTAADCKSVTFIPARVQDNPALLKLDPAYLSNLQALSAVERGRLLDGNWKVRPSAGMYFPRDKANIIPFVPDDVIKWVRSWDLAATIPTEESPDPDYTASVRLGERANGRFVIAHATRDRKLSHDARELVKKTAALDGDQVYITVPEDPGQAGKEQAASYIAMLRGFKVSARRATTDKVSRAEPCASQWQAGNFDVVNGPHLEVLLSELHSFPDSKTHDDQVDALSDAFAHLSKPKGGFALAAWKPT